MFLHLFELPSLKLLVISRGELKEGQWLLLRPVGTPQLTILLHLLCSSFIWFGGCAVAHATPPAPSPSVKGGLGHAVAEGMAFVAGNAIAHKVVDAVMGPRVIQHETVSSSAPASTSTPAQSVNSCTPKPFKSSGSDINKCQFYMDMLTECRRSAGSVLSA